jgi:hypothetical protein
MVEKASGWGGHIIGALASGITSSAEKLKNAFTSAVHGAFNAAKEWLSGHVLNISTGTGKDVTGVNGNGKLGASGGAYNLFLPKGMSAGVRYGPEGTSGEGYFGAGDPAVAHDDFQVSAHTAVVAPKLGKGYHYHIQFAGHEEKGGNTIAAEIIGPNGNVVGKFNLMHLESFGSGVQAGANLGGGAYLGRSGGVKGRYSSGTLSSGPHLHVGLDAGAAAYFGKEGYGFPTGFGAYNGKTMYEEVEAQVISV